MKRKMPLWYYYVLLISVVIIWGFDPIVYEILYQKYSPGVVCVICTFASFLFFLVLTMRKWKEFNVDYLKIAVPLGALNGLAGLLQRIGLQYTTPANYSFLENLSCVVVPIAMFAMVRKKPSLVQGVATILCLAGCFTISGSGGVGWNVGDLLCSLSGILYGICIAAIGVYARRLSMRLYMLVYMLMYFLISVASCLLLGHIRVGGVPIEAVKFSPHPGWLLLMVVFGLLSVGITWLMRTEAIAHIDPTAAAVISPFTAVIVAVVSVLCGMDRLRWQLVVGACLVLLAAILCGLQDYKKEDT